MKFQELTKTFQDKLKSLGVAYYSLRGDKDPENSFQIFIKTERSGSAWRRNYYWKFMRGIDAHRSRMGLEKLYTEDK